MPDKGLIQRNGRRVVQLWEIMTRSVETIAADASLKEAARKMDSERIGFLPVMEEGELIGVITDRDITVRAVAKGFDPEQTAVDEAMTNEVVCLPENSEIEDASDLMMDRNIRRLVVTDENDKAVGVVSMSKVTLYLGLYEQGTGIAGDRREFRDDFEAHGVISVEAETSADAGGLGAVGRNNRVNGERRRH